MKIGEVYESQYPVQGYFTVPAGAKWEVVGLGRENLYFLRLVGSMLLIEVTDKDYGEASNGKIPWLKRVEGAVIYK